VVAVEWESGNVNLTSITDTIGNTYSLRTKSPENTGGGVLAVQLGYCVSTGTASNTVTANFGASTGWANIIVTQYSGNGASPYEAEAIGAGNGGGGTAISTASLTASAGALLVGTHGAFANVTATWVTPTTEIIDNVGTVMAKAESLDVSSGSYAMNSTISSTTNWAAAMASFAAGAPATAGNFTILNRATRPAAYKPGIAR
jgi:hypothetical protein